MANSIRTFLSKVKNRLFTRKTPPPYTYKEFCEKLLAVKDINIVTYNSFKYHKSEQFPFDMDKDLLADKKTTFIRHDVDHDPFIALEMAKIEAELGIKSIYYILTTDSEIIKNYFKNSFKETIAAIKEIQNLGHEIGLHYDFWGDYFSDGKHPTENVKEVLAIFRNNGITINGCASHGSSRTRDLLEKNGITKYPKEYVNYSVWNEVKDTPSALSLNGKNIEAPVLSLFEHNLQYEAYYVRRNKYISDTGGIFWHLGEPIDVATNDLKKGEVLTILVHPIWWKKYMK